MTCEAQNRAARRRTAIERLDVSRPLRLAIQDGVLTRERTLFDYGCGRGGDLRRLKRLEFACAGWDPAYRNSDPQEPADIVNLGYVVNVIEDPVERIQTLTRAFDLARQVLVVSARLADEEVGLSRAKRYGDGVITSTGTFQKFFLQTELRGWIEQTLGQTPVAAGPGVYYVFRDEQERESFLASRARRSYIARVVPRATELFEQYKPLLAPLTDFMLNRGRAPGPGELENPRELAAIFGSVRQAVRVVTTAIGDNAWREVAEARAEDLLLYLAMGRFDGRPSLSTLPLDLQYDVKAFFGRYTNACGEADEALHRIGLDGLIDIKCQASAVGKLTPTALYIHESALSELPLELRVFEGCARNFLGRMDGGNIIKLYRREPMVSYLAYPDFDRVAHPELNVGMACNLRTFQIKTRNYRTSSNPPILHRKECFVGDDYQKRDLFQRLTRQEERAGLLGTGSPPGDAQGWSALLTQNNLCVRGHRLVRLK